MVVVMDSAATEEVTAESSLIKQSSALTAEDKELLACYHHGFDDEKVDIDLIVCLLYAIHSQSREGRLTVLLAIYQCVISSSLGTLLFPQSATIVFFC